MVNYNKLWDKLKEKGITTYTIRKKCQPEDLIEWKADLKPELAYENRFNE